MKQWEENIRIDAPIDEVWKLFDGALEDMQKVMPNLVANNIITETEEKIGTVYEQEFKGKRAQTYNVEVLKYENQSDYKKLKVSFPLTNIAHITATYELKKVDESTTHFYYITTNKPLKWIMRPLLFFSGNKAVVSFVRRVKRIAEEA